MLHHERCNSAIPPIFFSSFCGACEYFLVYLLHLASVATGILDTFFDISISVEEHIALLFDQQISDDGCLKRKFNTALRNLLFTTFFLVASFSKVPAYSAVLEFASTRSATTHTYRNNVL